jgi:hypothetical protein
MTEVEWLVCDEVQPMLNVLCGITGVQRLANERRSRLFGGACLRRVVSLFPIGSVGVCALIHRFATSELACQILDASDRFADGSATATELQWLQGMIPAPFEELISIHDREVKAMINAAYLALTSCPIEGILPVILHSMAAACTVAMSSQTTKDEATYQCALFREVFGNPFRPVTFNPEWRTSTVVALAQQMYESRNFSAMPILADALHDAGCDNEDILNHCRDPKATHVRGCWVVDLVLGKE